MATKKAKAASKVEEPKVKQAAPAKQKAAEKPTAKKAVAKPAPKNAAPKQAPEETSIFAAIEKADLVSFKALLAAQKNKRGTNGRTPLMVVNLIRSNTRMTDGSNYETKRVTQAKDIYDKMYQLLLEAKCDKNAMDDGGNTARDYFYGGICCQMLAD